MPPPPLTSTPLNGVEVFYCLAARKERSPDDFYPYDEESQVCGMGSEVVHVPGQKITSVLAITGDDPFCEAFFNVFLAWNVVEVHF